MKVLLDARPSYGGVHRVVRGLADGLRAHGEIELEAYGASDGRPVTADDRLPPLRRSLRPLVGSLRRVADDQWGLHRAIVRAAPDVVHSPHGLLPLRRQRPWVVSLWDLSPLDPGLACGPPVMARYRSWCFSRAIAYADHVIAPSEAVRMALVEGLGVPARRVTRVYPAFGPHIEVDDRALPEARHLLHVGTLEPRKNLGRLLDAIELLGPACTTPLVLAGRYGWSQHALLERIASLGNSVRWLGEVSDERLGELYRDAAVLIQPSLHEGFDLPVLEGLAAGVPVVASDIPVHREVAADCAIYAPVDDAAALAAAIREALGWSAEQRRARAAAARGRAAVLASSDPIAEHVRVYREVASGCPS
jgi:glycosyltransferase involved in cell wall biosynthesis